MQLVSEWEKQYVNNKKLIEHHTVWFSFLLFLSEQIVQTSCATKCQNFSNQRQTNKQSNFMCNKKQNSTGEVVAVEHGLLSKCLERCEHGGAKPCEILSLAHRYILRLRKDEMKRIRHKRTVYVEMTLWCNVHQHSQLISLRKKDVSTSEVMGFRFFFVTSRSGKLRNKVLPPDNTTCWNSSLRLSTGHFWILKQRMR